MCSFSSILVPERFSQELNANKSIEIGELVFNFIPHWVTNTEPPCLGTISKAGLRQQWARDNILRDNVSPQFSVSRVSCVCLP